MGWPLFYLVGSFADDISAVWKKRIMIIGAVCFLVSIFQMKFFPDASQGLQDFSPKYFFLVLAVYYGFQMIRVPAGIEKAVLFLAQYSYYVYLFHNTVIALFFSDKLGLYDSMITRTGTAFFMLIVFLTSVAVSILLGTVIQKVLDIIFRKK